ncbi:MAG: GtrA family protein [Candidatus Doudnabacteria bacterium]|nr:GtrA family protein [Candidatus Doudnabacteria bacterium]
MLSLLSDLLNKKPIILQLLKFGCIGALNAALDFILLNLLTETFSIQKGAGLGALNIVSVSAAIIQSYFWNKSWAFVKTGTVSVLKQFTRLVLVGGLGVTAFAAVLVGSQLNYGAAYFAWLLCLYIVLQLGVWASVRGDSVSVPSQSGTRAEFAGFVAVSVIGAGINSLILTGLVAYFGHSLPGISEKLFKNIAKIAATVVSLMWNFVGYKFFVFRK